MASVWVRVMIGKSMVGLAEPAASGVLAVADRPTDRRAAGVKLALALAFALGLLALYLGLDDSILAVVADGEALRRHIAALGVWGPLAVVGLMAGAIVFTPVPSAPIALAAGAAFGHGWGALYVLIGSGLGALIAFAVARLLGYELLRRWLGDRLPLGPLGSQNALTLIVFVSRLLPFISFDLVSYAAGLTPLRTWRFVLATFAGIAPASFVLAHFGSEIISAGASRLVTAAVVLGGLTMLPVVVKLVQRRRARARGTDGDD